MMKYGLEWLIDFDELGWYLEYWNRGEYWSSRQQTRLESQQFESAIIEARKILNLD